jgi:hypothetical protein
MVASTIELLERLSEDFLVKKAGDDHQDDAEGVPLSRCATYSKKCPRTIILSYGPLFRSSGTIKLIKTSTIQRKQKPEGGTESPRTKASA